MPALYMLSRSIIIDSRSIIDNSNSVIDDGKKCSKLWRHSLMTLEVSFTIVFFYNTGANTIKQP